MKRHPRPIPLSTHEEFRARLDETDNLCLIVSVTRDCVLQCEYCYAIDPQNLPPKRVLPLDTLEKIIQDAFEVRHKSVTFEWTGGEALLAGRKFFERVLELQIRYARPDKTYHNCLQTSGGIYNESLYDFLIENGFGLGITIDGPRDLHEAQRPRKGGTSSFDNALKSYRYIKAKQGRCGVLCTLTKNTLGRFPDILRFYEEIEAFDFHTNPYVYDPSKPVREAKLGVTAKEYAEYFKNQFDTHIRIDDKRFKPSYVGTLMRNISGIPGGSKCTHAGRCLTNFINIDDEGNAAICPKFLGYASMRLGNIRNASIRDLLSPDNPVMRRFLDQRLQAVNGCEKDGCAYLMVCNSGCPYDSFLNGRDESLAHRDFLCPGKHELYEHIDETLQSFGMETITSVQSRY